MIRTSEEIAEIAKALAAAQAEMENVARDRENPHFRSRYATLGGVLDEVRPKLAKHGIAVMQMPVNGEGSSVGVMTRLMHASGQWIEGVFFVAPTKADAQGAGSALTYCRRYSLMAVAGVGPDDDDAQAAVGLPQNQPRPGGNGVANGRISEGQRAELDALADKVNADKRKFCDYFGIPSLAELPAPDYARAKQMLADLPAARERARTKTEQHANGSAA